MQPVDVQQREDAALGAAWRRCEAALPLRQVDGRPFNTSGGVGLALYRHNNRTYVAEWGTRREYDTTPTTALEALAEALEARRAAE